MILKIEISVPILVSQNYKTNKQKAKILPDWINYYIIVKRVFMNEKKVELIIFN